jgi:N-acetylmuramoyl-L-alanine amidase
MKRIVIAVDAGHGGADPGAIGHDLVEAHVTEELANTRFPQFARGAGHQVALTRTAGGASLELRVQRALQAKAALFLSIHINAANSLARGFQVWYHGGDEHSRAIAARMHQMVTGALPQWAGNGSRISADTERYHSGFAVLRGTWRHMPALLLEIGFLSNEADADLLRDPVLKQATMLEVMAAVAASLAHGEI